MMNIELRVSWPPVHERHRVFSVGDINPINPIKSWK